VRFYLQMAGACLAVASYGVYACLVTPHSPDWARALVVVWVFVGVAYVRAALRGGQQP